MTDWQMLVEKWDSATASRNSPTTPSSRPGPKRFTTTLKYLRAWRGQFIYEDHEAPWSVVARNIDIKIGNLPNYHGTATFTGGTVAIQNYVPIAAKHARELLDRRGPDPPRSHRDRDRRRDRQWRTGVVDVRHWPEQTYQFKSRVAVSADAPAVLQG